MSAGPTRRTPNTPGMRIISLRGQCGGAVEHHMIMLTMMKHQTLIATHSEENMRQPFSGYWLLESAAATRTSATMASRRDLAQGLLGL